MLKIKLSSLLFACLSTLSVAVSAAESSKAKPQAVEAMQQVAQIARVNLNSADVEALQSGLVGIGRVKAQAIIEYRDANGPFASVDELLEVKGIGESTLERNRDRLTIN